MKDQENTHLSVGLPEALFDLHLWDPLSPQACEEIARFVEKRLPASFRFLHVEACAAGTQHHHLALFEWKPSARHPPTSFVLIPGGTATLGYDRTQSLVPDEEAVREWLDSHLYRMDLITRDAEVLRDCFPLEDEEVSAQKSEALYAHMDQILSSLRTVTISPFLLEVTARAPQEIVVGPRLTYHRQTIGGRTWISRGRTWPPPLPHQMVAHMLEREGFRLPTSDEWEYACAAGSRTFFYWGNGPFDVSSKAQYPPPATNAFGLSIAHDAYAHEFCAEPGIMRGGDGGCAECGCEGWLARSLPLASAYMNRVPEEWLITGVHGCVGYLGYPFYSFTICRSDGAKDFCIFGSSIEFPTLLFVRII